ncbi:hypothetical protein Vadar_034342 [Vaccinium darrowii]|uniref:Uncharacterized protein n=1 Tax=Vaccinium darrowii TaxID=229202 RepID=A0ACB7XLU2_9ERIC|nr:hypothetical protein Vadar_034342 [Vaccinium darrowii]
MNGASGGRSPQGAVGTSSPVHIQPEEMNEQQPISSGGSGAQSSQAAARASSPGDHRTIYWNGRDSNLKNVKFKGNSITTTKYSVVTFLPKCLFEQFRRAANLYFLMISILSSTPLSPATNPVSPISNVLPLSFVVFVSLVKEAWDDWNRLQHDKAINNSKVYLLRDRNWVSASWKELQVGDIVKVKQGELFPADLLFLASTDTNGFCYMETANLDGETNLKIRTALEKTRDCLTFEKASEFNGEVTCEHPNNSVYTFTGNLIIESQTVPLSSAQLLLRGCSLRNTEYITGAVIFSGHETKVKWGVMVNKVVEAPHLGSL